MLVKTVMWTAGKELIARKNQIAIST